MKWAVKDIIERISKAFKVYFWVGWLEDYIEVDKSVALNKMKSFPPDLRIEFSVKDFGKQGDIVFLGSKVTENPNLRDIWQVIT